MDGKGYRGLDVWHKAMDVSVALYAFTADLPSEERYRLKSQMRRSAVSIASNIAEGYGRRSTGDYLKFLGYAQGSLAELETQIELAVRVSVAERDSARATWGLCQETGKMLYRLSESLRKTARRPGR